MHVASARCGILSQDIHFEIFDKLASGAFRYGMTCVVEFDPNSLWHEISLAITVQALRHGVKVEYHVFQHTPEQIRSALKRMGVDLDKFESEASFRIMDSYTSTTPLAGSTEGVREPLLSGKSPDIALWTKAIRDKMKDGFEEEEKRWLHIDDNETTLLQFSDEESILNGWRTTFVPMAKSRELLILHGLVVGIASESFYRKTETMADAVIDVRAREEGGRLENYIRLRSLRESKFDSRWHKIELTNEGEIDVEASDSEQSRRLAAIMFTDIVGYTALTQANEAQALEVLNRHNRLLRPFFPKYHGREIKTIGDSFLIEFGSALDATNCAIEIQKFLHDYNISTKEDWKIKLRIGIHLGDVIHMGKDILGDAVNIASRIEPLADPEGICISEQVYDQIHNKIICQLDLLESAAQLKNVKFQTNVYALVLPWEESRRRIVGGRKK
jgi:class 3 adenylate cyclase